MSNPLVTVHATQLRFFSHPMMLRYAGSLLVSTRADTRAQVVYDQ